MNAWARWMEALTSPASARSRRVIVLCSIALSSAILLRCFVTPLGLGSFGRIWQYHSSWQALGFVRRGLIGTLYTALPIDALVSSAYAGAYLFYVASFAVLYAAVSRITSRREDLTPIALVAIYLSPALFSHLAYGTGNLDLYLVVLLVSALASDRWWPRALAIVLGVLSHESFVTLVPLLLLAQWQVDRRDAAGPRRTLALTGVALASAVVVLLFGDTKLSLAEYTAIMQPRLRDGFGAHSSGYFELSSSLDDNQQRPSLAGLLSGLTVGVIPLAWLALVTTLALRGADPSGLPRPARALLGLAIACPLALALVAADFYRWLCFSGILALLGMLRFAAPGSAIWSSRLMFAAAAFALASPIGALPERPLPLHAFVFERLGR
jgi:hypothetical protein